MFNKLYFPYRMYLPCSKNRIVPGRWNAPAMIDIIKQAAGHFYFYGIEVEVYIAAADRSAVVDAEESLKLIS